MCASATRQPCSTGEEFEIAGRLTAVNRRRLTFEVDVTGPQGVVSRGTHERAVVSLDRMG